MTESALHISVVIPVYNSSQCLAELLRQLTAQLEQIGRSYEIVMVEDSSPDDSWRVIEGLAARYPLLRAIRLMRNTGQAKATLCGLTQVHGQLVFTMDDDLQHRPDQMPALLQALESDPQLDCVFGVFKQKKHAWYRNIGSKAVHWLNKRAFDMPDNLQSSSFRLMRGTVARAVTAHHTENPAILGLILASTSRVQSVTVEHAERYAGRSNYGLGKQFRLAFDSICNVSMLPLRMVTFMGLLCCLLSMLMVVIVLVQYNMHHIGVAGWTTVVILVSFFSGVILLSLGVIGEYLMRIMREARGSPRFLIRQRVGFGSDAAGASAQVLRGLVKGPGR